MSLVGLVQDLSQHKFKVVINVVHGGIQHLDISHGLFYLRDTLKVLRPGDHLEVLRVLGPATLLGVPDSLLPPALARVWCPKFIYQIKNLSNEQR